MLTKNSPAFQVPFQVQICALGRQNTHSNHLFPCLAFQVAFQVTAKYLRSGVCKVRTPIVTWKLGRLPSVTIGVWGLGLDLAILVSAHLFLPPPSTADGEAFSALRNEHLSLGKVVLGVKSP